MIPFLDFNNPDPPLHFAHANGYPPECYRPLLTKLSAHYHVIAMHLRPLWPDARPEDLGDWRPLAEDLLRFLDERGLDRLIGVGHSLGAVTMLRAALRQPERFHALVLIDPVLFPPRMIYFWNAVMRLGLGYRIHPLITSALRRRRVFQSREVVSNGYRRKSIFRYMDDASLRAYTEGITRLRPEGGFELVYSPEWEARIYATGILADMDIWRRLSGLEIPLLIMRGAETDTFWESTAKRVQRVRPETTFVTIQKATHLVPLEKPDEVYQTIRQFLEGLGERG